jgi:hypothetical protein
MEVRQLVPSVLNSMQHIPAGGDWRSIPVEHQSPWVVKMMKTKGSTNWFPRSAWDAPARTLTTMVGNNKATPHCPDELRCLSVEEFAAIQTFPPEFCFAGSSQGQKYRQIGNAVPCEVRAGGCGALEAAPFDDWGLISHGVNARAVLCLFRETSGHEFSPDGLQALKLFQSPL